MGYPRRAAVIRVSASNPVLGVVAVNLVNLPSIGVRRHRKTYPSGSYSRVNNTLVAGLNVGPERSQVRVEGVKIGEENVPLKRLAVRKDFDDPYFKRTLCP